MMSKMRSLTSRNENHQYFKSLQQRKLMFLEVMFPSSKHVRPRQDTSVAKIHRQQKDVADFSKNVVLHQDVKDVMIVIRIVIIPHSARKDDTFGISIKRPQKMTLKLISLKRSIMEKI